MMDLLVMVIQWIAGLLPGGDTIARGEFVPIPVRADFSSRRGGSYPASSPGVGGMTMRLDSVPRAHVLSQSAFARGAWATRPRSMLGDGT